MRVLRIFVSGAREDTPREREALTRALRSLRFQAARIDLKYSDECEPRDAITTFIYQCDICIGLYDRTHYDWARSAIRLSFVEQEFNEAQRLEKPQLIFIRQLQSAEKPNSQQSAFIDRVINVGDKNVHVSEFSNLAQLEDQIAEAVIALVSERFELRVTRPIFQAPSMLQSFVGREPQIEKLVNALALGQAVLIHGVGDTGGMGKTELAVYVAHRLRDQFPDGVLWADVQTARPGDLLVTWARMFGGFALLGSGDLRFEYRRISAEERRISETAARVDEAHRVLRGRRVLAILDGVIDEQDDLRIEPLLRALGDCAVIVTSRTSRLRSFKPTSLVDLERMNESEAWDVFERILGAGRLENQRALVTEIGQVVDFLPFALDLAASLLRERYPMVLKTLFEFLRSERESLEASQWGYRSMRGMQSALNVSYMFLSEDDKKFFAALGAFGGDDFDAEAAVSVAEATPYVAARTLEQLAKRALAHDRHRPERYTLHPVVRNYARDKLQDQSAEVRMAKYYCGIAKDYGRELLGSESRSAHTTLTVELSNIFAAHNYAQRRNDPIGWELCRDFIHGAMTSYFNLHAMWSDWINWCEAGLEACQKLRDQRSANSIASSLAMVYQRKGEWDQAIEFYENALAMMEKLGNIPGTAAIHMNLGTVYTEKKDWAKALASLNKSLLIREKLGDAHGVAQTRANLGMLYAKHGERTRARALWTQALEVFVSLQSQNEADIIRKWLKQLPPPGRE